MPSTLTALDKHARPAPVALAAEWLRQAACKGRDDVMDPDLLSVPQVRRARAICRTCPVLADCGTWVLSLPQADDPSGIAAGMTPKKRADLRSELRKREQ